MNTRRTCSHLLKLLVLVLLATAFSASPLRADGISFSLTATTLSTTSGGDVVFTGTVTNDTGGDLNATDFFFNFMGYDSTSVTPNQDLGFASDSASLDIPNTTTSPVVALFDIALGTVSPGSTFPVQVDLEDVNNDLSSIVTVDVTVPGETGGGTGGGSGSGSGSGSGGGTTQAPEPASLLLLGAGLSALLASRRRIAPGT